MFVTIPAMCMVQHRETGTCTRDLLTQQQLPQQYVSIHRPTVGGLTDERVSLVDVLKGNRDKRMLNCTGLVCALVLGQKFNSECTFSTPTPLRYIYPKPASPVPSFCKIVRETNGTP